MFLATASDRLASEGSCSLRAANGSGIKTYGMSTRHLDFPDIAFSHKFVLADVTRPLLGADFFDAHDLCVDFKGKRILKLVDNRVVYTIPASLTTADSAASSFQVVKATGGYQDLLAKFPEVQQPRFGTYRNAHGVTHSVPTRGAPFFAKAQRICPERLACARQEFDKMLKDGIVRRSDSPWSSPLHMGPKVDGLWRPCGDFRRLNDAMEDDRYPLPHIQDFGSNLHGSRIFSVLDLQRGYHQIPMDTADIKKTAIITPFGLFEYLRMPFGMKNKPSNVSWIKFSGTSPSRSSI